MDDIRDQKEQQIPTAIDVGGSIKGLKMTNNLFVNCLPLKVEGEIENSSFEGNRTILSDSLQEEKTENIKSANEIKKNKNIP